MKLLQKFIFIGGLIIASIYFIYTLSFSTGWAYGQPLGDFYTEAQYVNKLIYKWALWTVIFAGVNILLNSHKNRNLYLLNYLFILLFVVSLVGSGITTLVHVPPLKISYLEVNQIILDIVLTVNLATISTKIFDYGIYISILLFIEASLVIFITVIKTLSQIKRAKIKKLRRLEYTHENS